MKTIQVAPRAAEQVARFYSESVPTFDAPLTSQAVHEHYTQHRRLLSEAHRPNNHAGAHRAAAGVHAALGSVHAALDQGNTAQAADHLSRAQRSNSQIALRDLPESVRSGLELSLSRAHTRTRLAQDSPVPVAFGEQLSTGVSPAQQRRYAQAAPPERTITAGEGFGEVARAYASLAIPAGENKTLALTSTQLRNAASQLGRAYSAAAQGDGAGAETALQAARTSLNEVVRQNLTPETARIYQQAVDDVNTLKIHLAAQGGQQEREAARTQSRAYASTEASLRSTPGTLAQKRPLAALADGCASLSRAYAHLAAGEGKQAAQLAQSARLSADCAPSQALSREAQLVRAKLYADADAVAQRSQGMREYAFEVPVEATNVAPVALVQSAVLPLPQVDEAATFLELRDKLALASMSAPDMPTLSALGALSRAYASAYGAVISARREDGQANTYKRRVQQALSGLQTSGLQDRLPDWAKLAQQTLAARFA